MTGQNDFSIVRFSTDDLPEKDRATIWREQVAPSVFKVEVGPVPPDTAVKVDVVVRSLSRLRLSSGCYSAGSTVRTPRLIAADGSDDFILCINTSGNATLSARRRELSLNCGAILTDDAEVSTLDRRGFGGSTGIRIPRSTLAGLVVNVEDFIMRPISRDTSAFKLLNSYVIALLTDDAPVLSAELPHLVASQITDLVALTLGATRDAGQIAQGRGVPAARLHAARAYIMENSGRQNLTAENVAAHLGVTSRHVQRLFEKNGTTFSKFLLNHRLTRAYRMLCEPRFSFWEIGKIASHVGFSDPSHFGRCFRKLYGSAPRDIRRRLGVDDH
jgi:AraC-like DNA-binding protein